MTVTGDAAAAVIDLVPRGPWSERLCDQVSKGLRLCGAGPADSIIADLRGVSDPYGVSLPFWLSAWRQVRLGPSPVHLALCLHPETRLAWRIRNLRGPQPRVYDSVRDARIAVAERMSRADRRQARLPARPDSVPAARHLVTQACGVWDLPHLLEDTLLIVSELAANAVQHAGTDFIVTTICGVSGLHVAVRDGAGRFPYPGKPASTSSPGPLAERGRGLLLVHAAAVAWGAMPTLGGKVVWATVGL
ncbi:ATP-binding protein [Actinoplanes sp. NEAU-A12]|uniref:ATP-binding protein n=1 Tax=Actinoplanes sandaracinus TaxID=3045177 RepID=A0ABT6WHY0_9ACTN|nr:ATP-binding protein [Actinoplanes sandaracinus]MDI6099325.1 ATP-binding protein [Actinoplanes sandaracinus]